MSEDTYGGDEEAKEREGIYEKDNEAKRKKNLKESKINWNLE